MLFRHVFFLGVLLFVLPIFQACAPVTARPEVDPNLAIKEQAIQKRMAVEARLELLQRLSRVSQPVMTEGVPLCGDQVAYYIGMDVNSAALVSEEWVEAYREVQGLVGEYLTVTYVIDGSPAQAAGFMAGDVIINVNGQKVEPGKDSFETFWEILSEEGGSGDVMTFWVEREGVPTMLQVTPVLRCDYPVVMSDEAFVNAFADGESVVVTKGLMKFVESDDELALVVGHEMGHNVMGHIDKKSGNMLMGAILDGLIAGVTGVHTTTFQNAAGMAYSQEYEHEADYVGIYFMERAGYDGSNAPAMWRRMGADNPYAITHATTHPTSATRYVFLGECSKEIAAKRRDGRELLPDLEDGSTVSEQ